MGCVKEQLLWRQGVWAWNQKEAGFSRGWFVPVNIWLFFNVLMSLEYNAWNKRFENDSFFYLYFAFTHQYHHSIKFRGFCCQIDPKTEMFIEEGKLVSNIIGTNCESFF